MSWRNRPARSAGKPGRSGGNKVIAGLADPTALCGEGLGGRLAGFQTDSGKLVQHLTGHPQVTRGCAFVESTVNGK
jgi:hypothetical protein